MDSRKDDMKNKTIRNQLPVNYNVNFALLDINSKKAMPKNVPTTAQLHSSYTLVK